MGAAAVKDKAATATANHAVPVALPSPKQEEIPDDRDRLQPGEPCVLIVEDDPHYARVLLGLVRDKGFKGLVALARQHRPCRWPSVISPPPSRSISFCPTCWAGRSSAI